MTDLNSIQDIVGLPHGAEKINDNRPDNKHRYCVVMCGGIGTRFWPYSRTDMPKQFIDILGTGRTLLQMTVDRLLPLIPMENMLVVTNARYADLVKEQLPELDPSQILLEPDRRNTAPCIAWAAYHLAAKDPEATMIVTPSDHFITRERLFEAEVLRGFEFIEEHDALLTLGVNPTRPDTGYGYIQVGSPVTSDVSRVKTFTEKPDLELARVFVDSGEFLWNAGIFLWKASVIKEAIARWLPDLAAELDLGADCFGTPRENDFINAHFGLCPRISIDYGVMQKADNVCVERVEFGWSDLGTWGSVYDNSPKNRDSNVTQNCNVLTYDSTGNIFAVRDRKLVVASGLHGYIVADTGDVLMICPITAEQSIRQIVSDVESRFNGKFV